MVCSFAESFNNSVFGPGRLLDSDWSRSSFRRQIGQRLRSPRIRDKNFVSKRGEPPSQCAADVACSNDTDSHSCLPIQFRIRSGFFTLMLDEISRHCACNRFFAIPKEIIFPSRCIAGDRLANCCRRGEQVFIRRRFCLHSFCILEPLGKLGDRSLGTTISGPRSARAACSSNAAFALDLT